MSAAVVAEAKPPASKRAEAQRHFDAAVAHYKAQEYDAAVEEFESAYKLRPEPHWLFNLGSACRLAKQWDKALDYYRQYLDALPDADNRAVVEQRIAEVEQARGPGKRMAETAPAAPPEPSTPPSAPPSGQSTAPPAAVSTAPVPTVDLPRTPYQLGARIRGLFVTNAMLKPYLQAATQMNSWSIGVEFIYRRPKYDVVTSFDVSSLAVDDGNWLGNGQNASDATHLLQFRGVYLISLDVSLIGYTQLTKWLELRYGGGVGLGVVTGNVLDTHDSSQCTSQNASNIAACNPFTPPVTGAALEPALKKTEGPTSDAQDNPHRHPSPDKWPAAPVVNLLMGLRFKLPHKFSAQIELGFRDAIFFGAGAHYSF